MTFPHCSEDLSSSRNEEALQGAVVSGAGTSVWKILVKLMCLCMFWGLVGLVAFLFGFGFYFLFYPSLQLLTCALLPDMPYPLLRYVFTALFLEKNCGYFHSICCDFTFNVDCLKST